MLKIWGRKNSINVQKVLWTCGELGLQYERIDAGLAFGVVEEHRKLLAANWHIVDAQLASRNYLAGNAFTPGDIPMGVAAYRWFNLPIERPAMSNVERWYKRLCERPAFKEHCMLPLT